MLVICERSGIGFETDSKRIKNHPAVMKVVNAAGRDGATIVNTTMKKVKAAGGYETVEEFLALVKIEMNQLQKEQREKEEAFYVKQALEKKRKIEAQKKFEQNNKLLKANGYEWYRMQIQDETDGMGELGEEWVLFSPDGSVVTVAEALTQIKNK